MISVARLVLCVALAAGLAREWERAYPKAFPQRNDKNARKMKTMRGKVTCLWQHFAPEESRKNAAGFITPSHRQTLR